MRPLVGLIAAACAAAGWPPCSSRPPSRPPRWPQAAALAGHLSARENVALAAQIRGRPDSGAVTAALAAVGLCELADRRAGELSGGERQRLAVARALVTRPAVLLADEPTANLDQRNAIAVARLLADAARHDGMLVLCATHDPSVIAEAGRVVELHRGADG